METRELDYDLPAELIATAPATPRDAARLMVIDRGSEGVSHRRVADLASPDGPLQPGDLLVFNQTKVLPARFSARRAATGGRIDGLYLESPTGDRWVVMLESRGRLRAGERIELTADASIELIESRGRGEWLAGYHADRPAEQLLHEIGSPPLPPYIRKQRRIAGEPEDRPEDIERYNTVYAREAGSAAAPTAGLHFTPDLLGSLDARGVRRAMLTLHVGLGTFAPVRSDTLEDHDIHREHIRIPTETIDALRRTRDTGGRIIPVGTTSVRALESLPDAWRDLPAELTDHAGAYVTDTGLFITPGFDFRFTDGLMTNFHLPRSTLLALVAALPNVGIERLKRWYRLAIDERYRFYSYGDAMLLL